MIDNTALHNNFRDYEQVAQSLSKIKSQNSKDTVQEFFPFEI